MKYEVEGIFVHRVFATIVGCVALFAIVGCGGVSTRTAEDERTADALVGRWTGVAVDPPQHAWFEFGTWDVWFGQDGDFSAVVSTGPGDRFPVHLEGPYRLDFGTMYIDQSSLAGKWKIVFDTKDRIEMSSEEVHLRLDRRFGT